MLKDTPPTIYLKDYTPPDYLIDAVDLEFDLGETFTRVKSQLRIRRHDTSAGDRGPLVLHGREMELIAIALDGLELTADDYEIDDETLTIHAVPEAFSLEIETRIRPQDNTSLEGLYVSSGMFCTQCEAEGFRKITYYLDRSDVMARFTTTLIADRERYPVLLSNGNLVESGELDDGRHWARWQDPFKKPSYLFALVAGQLDCLEDEYITASGRSVSLRLYVEPGNLEKCGHAMASLKKAMQWDEANFGLEYDLDIYMIVAVGDFNMGAMENKGLNVFNTAYVLARPETATDTDYENIEAVIAHEYFHNWTGNRVTCRDWFQLSLKEGLTVFRDQEFSADQGSRAVKRINDVRSLRSRQFPEDAGPMAHPVRPESYVEINNFYTATVYEKGAAVVRMIHTLVGAQGFRKGMALYFERHDGQAVTTDDFVQAMADANGKDLEQFRRWYSQAGTPVLSIHTDYDVETSVYTFTVKQSCPSTPDKDRKQPFHIPLLMGLLDHDGKEVPLQLENGTTLAPYQPLELFNRQETVRFINVSRRPVLSLLRDFSAPVKLEVDLSDADLAFLFAHDTDPFNRWDAGQQLAIRILTRLIDDTQQGRELVLDTIFIEAMGKTLTDPRLDKALVAEAMILPSEGYLVECLETADPHVIFKVRLFVRRALAAALRAELQHVYEQNQQAGNYHYHCEAAGQRRLKNQALSLLMETGDPQIIDRCMRQFSEADNMTDVLGALGPLANSDCPQRTEALAAFYEKGKDDPLVVDKWFAIQATSRLPDTLREVERLLRHPAFEIKNPNKVRALIGAFSHGNPVRFHDPTGAGYAFLAEQVLRLDPLNPQVAARLTGAFNRWRKYDAGRQGLIKEQLERIVKTPGLSRAVYEIVSKSLR